MDKRLGLGNESSPKEDEEGKKDDVDDDTSDLARAKVVLERAQQAETEASNEWVLETSCLAHHTFNRRLLAVVGECGGSVQTERFKVPDVRYIEGETRNVISVAQLARRHGLVTVFEPTSAYVRDPATGQNVGRAHLSNGIYVLDYLLVEQLNEGSVKAQRQVEAGGSCGGGGGGIGGSDGGKERKGGDGGGSGGTTGGQGRGGAGAAGEGRDEGREEERDDSGSGGQDGDDEVEELEESSQMQDGIFGQPRSDRVATACVSFFVDMLLVLVTVWSLSLGISTAIESITGVCRGSKIRVHGIGYVDSAGGSLDRVLFVPDTQLSNEYFAKVAFHSDKMWIDRMETGERIGHGHRVGGHYVLDRFEAECLVQRYQRRA